MRLIDANELKIYISTTFCDTCKRDKGVCSSCAFDDVFIAIDNAPTIDAEPVKHGTWTITYTAERWRHKSTCQKGVKK